MLNIGTYQDLVAKRQSPPGVFLENELGEEILLPNKYIPKTLNIGDTINVFVYLDFDERLIATTIHPYATLNQFAMLEAVDITTNGAFLYWGLEKDLFVPFKEQRAPMRKGEQYLVYIYFDKSSGRLAATEKYAKFLKKEIEGINEGDTVDLIIGNKTELGVNVIINEEYAGLVYNDDIYIPITKGDKITGYIKTIREDNKIDVTLQPMGYKKQIEPNAQKVLDVLGRRGGKLALGDNSSPEMIKDTLGMSKKNFKKAIGFLYKQKMILISDSQISLI